MAVEERNSDDSGSARAGTSSREPPKTLGEKLFRAIPYSLAQHSARLAVGSKQTIAEWRNGVRRPSGMYRARISAHYGIHPSAWDQDPETPVQTAIAAETTDDDEREEKDVTEYTPLESCLRLLRDVQKHGRIKNLLVAERLKLADAEGKLIALRQKLETDQKLLEHRFVREHPSWLRARKIITATLVKYPAAAREVADALRSMDL